MINKKAFTLIEVILVVAIIGMLAWVLFKTYITMSQIAFRVEQQKIVSQELLFVTEIFQNLANRNEIDYTKYNNVLDNNINLVETRWLSNILYMSWEDWMISIFSSGDCVSLNDDIDKENLKIWCNLILQKNDKNIVLTKDLVYMTDALFKIIPFADEETYIKDSDLCKSNYLACIGDPWFWFISNIYNKWHDEFNRTNNVSIFVQQFFNI